MSDCVQCDMVSCVDQHGVVYLEILVVVFREGLSSSGLDFGFVLSLGVIIDLRFRRL